MKRWMGETDQSYWRQRERQEEATQISQQCGCGFCFITRGPGESGLGYEKPGLFIEPRSTQGGLFD